MIVEEMTTMTRGMMIDMITGMTMMIMIAEMNMMMSMIAEITMMIGMIAETSTVNIATM